RTDETAFQVDHFRAICRFGGAAPGERRTLTQIPSEMPAVALDPDRDLYGAILFQSGRFKQLRGYRHLRATECVAEIACHEAADWFGLYLPSGLVLGDPGARDAAIHAIQACIPHATILPTGVDRLTINAT